MIPSSFKYSNKLLGAPRGHVPEESEVGEICALPVWTDGQQCVSLWRPTWRERISILFYGQVWCQVWFGQSQPPICLVGMKDFIREQEPAERWLRKFKRGVRWRFLWERIHEKWRGRRVPWWLRP